MQTSDSSRSYSVIIFGTKYEADVALVVVLIILALLVALFAIVYCFFCCCVR